MPAEIPVTTLDALMVATALLLLVHVPPPVTSISVVVKPIHTLAVPVMAPGMGFTVMVFVVLQPVGSKYVITGVDVPDTPVTMPVAEPMVASVVIELLQMPPGVVLLKVVVAAIQTVAGPEIADGSGLIVTACVAVV